MAEKSGIWIVGILVLSFVLVSLIANLLSTGGIDIGQIGASVFGLKTQLKTADPEKCECEYSVEFQDFMCNEYCGDMSGAFCLGKPDCLA